MSLAYGGSFNEVNDVSYVAGSITVGTSQVLAAASGSNLSLRQELIIYNKSASTIYFGPTGVTTSTGIPIGPTEVLNLPFSQNVSVFLISGTAGNTVIVQELA